MTEGQQTAPAIATLRVVVAEDNALLREGLQMLLERNDFAVAAAVASADELMGIVPQVHPDLVITDVRMPPTLRAEGLAAAVRLREADPDLPVVVLSQYVEQSYVAELLDSAHGVGIGYLLKDRVSDVREFTQTLRRVHAGGTAVDPAVITQMINRRRDPRDRLTPREREVLEVMAEGHSNAAIARRLVISEAAVVKHIGNVLMKLELPPNDDQNRRVIAVLTHLRGEDHR
ncbi:MAG: response regulator transcription factor [Propionibacteriales bacterium]|nr:response regulator transcription factor [Propionibacteriales bacterium]